MAQKVVYSVPGVGFITREKSKPTKYIQDKETGRLKGRRVVKEGEGDKTRVNRIKKDFILVKKTKDKRGHIRTVRKDYDPGQIYGRS